MCPDLDSEVLRSISSTEHTTCCGDHLPMIWVSIQRLLGGGFIQTTSEAMGAGYVLTEAGRAFLAHNDSLMERLDALRCI